MGAVSSGGSVEIGTNYRSHGGRKASSKFRKQVTMQPTSPYLLGNTIDTIDKTANGNLLDLSQIGDIPYSTDSFGIEPPMRNTTQKGNATNTWNMYMEKKREK